MPLDAQDGILELLVEANSPEQLIQNVDDEQVVHEVLSALDGDGRMFELEHDFEYEELDTVIAEALLRMQKYLFMEPPDKQPQKIRP